MSSPEQALALAMEGIGVWTWDLATGACTWSPGLADLVGTPASDLPHSIGELLARLPVDQRREIRAGLDTAVAHPEGTTVVRPLVRSDGEPRWLRWSARALRDDDGTPCRVVATVVDVTAERREELALDEQHARDAMVREISTRFITLPSDQVDRGIHEALARVGGALGATGGTLWVVDDDGAHVNPVRRWRAAGTAPRTLVPLPLVSIPWLAARLADDEIVMVPAVDDLPAEAAGERAYLEQEGFGAVLLVPLVVDGRLRAAVGFSGPPHHPWPLVPGPVLRALADACVTALVRKRTDEQRQRAGARQGALARLSAVAMSDVTLTELAGTAATMVAELLPAPLAEVCALEEDALHVLGGHGWDRELEIAQRRSLDPDELLGYAIRSAEPAVLVEDARTETHVALPSEAVAEGVRAAVVVPLGAPEGIVGLVAVYDRTPRAFDLGALHFLESVANLLAVGLIRRRAEQQLREAHAVLSHLVESGPVVMFRGVEGNLALDYVSPNVERVFGLPPDDAATRWPELVHPEDREAARAASERVRAEGAGEYEARFRCADGTWVVLRVVLRVDGPDRPRALVGYAMDMTERRAAEERLRRAEKLEAVGQLAGGVAHDFNNLLTVIQGYVEVVAARVEASELGEVLAAVEHAQVLVDQLLTFSRKRPSATEAVDVNAVACGVVRMVERLIDPDVAVEVALAADLPPALVDPARLEQALVNLLLNARDAMPQGGTVTLATEAVADGERPDELRAPHVRVVVADTGHGMTPEVRARAFEPFFTTKGEGRGTGLGLPTVYGAVTSWGGQVVLDSREGEGTTVALHLPVGDLGSLPVRVEPPAAQSAVGGAGCVLLVEDQPQIRDLVTGVLDRAGYEVVAAGDGEEALRLASGRPLDLLVTDVSMPGLKGPDLARILRGSHPGLRVLYMSGFSPGPRLEGGAFLQKPFSLGELHAAVRAALS